MQSHIITVAHIIVIVIGGQARCAHSTSVVSHACSVLHMRSIAIVIGADPRFRLDSGCLQFSSNHSIPSITFSCGALLNAALGRTHITRRARQFLPGALRDVRGRSHAALQGAVYVAYLLAVQASFASGAHLNQAGRIIFLHAHRCQAASEFMISLTQDVHDIAVALHLHLHECVEHLCNIAYS